MAKEPELSDLAQKYLDLWEQEMSDLAGDADVARYWAQYWQRVGEMTGDIASAFGPGPSGDAAPVNTPTDPPGTSAAAAAPDAGLGNVDSLARRLAALEKRVADLESTGRKPAATQKKSAKTTPRPRTSKQRTKTTKSGATKKRTTKSRQ